MYEDENLAFNCKDCGSEDLIVEIEYGITEEFENTLECSCDEDNDFAARRTYSVTTYYREINELEEDHHIGAVLESEILDEDEQEESEFEVQCHNCLEEASESDWTIKTISSEIDEDSKEFYVRCRGCDREIEFGWSHPGRGGRIWPLESKEFNPWKCWPEPRYYDNWLKRGWIRPDFR